VITVEPGIYIPPSEDVDPKWWNIGIRIEDDVLITDEGSVVLSERAPRTVGEIESLMAETGLGNDPSGRVR
jgi:Xaa-Pro aminopeptidase